MPWRMDAAGPMDAQNASTGPWKTAQNAVSHSAHTHQRLTRSTHEIPDSPGAEASTLLVPSNTLHEPPSTLQVPSSTLQVPPSTLQVPPSTLQVPPSTLQVPPSTLRVPLKYD